MELMNANTQWSSRPSDERFTSLHDMETHFNRLRGRSRQLGVSTRAISVVPTEDNKGLAIRGANGLAYAPTNWAFGQLAQLAEAPAGYLRTLPAPIAADCVNYGLQFKRNIEDIGVLLQKPVVDVAGDVTVAPVLAAATGPRYGRIWNADILQALVKQFGNGVDGQFKVPGTFGNALDTVTKENTTLFAGDRDMFVFLADEENRIEVPNRRNGETGTLARGFFVWNSEVGASTFGVGTFLFDYVCCNRIVWGAEGYKEIKMRHTSAAPDRFLQEIRPALVSYANSSTSSITAGIEAARAARVDDVDEFLAKRFGTKTVESLKAIHMLEEQRPIETVWDVVTAVTAKARSVEYQDSRVQLERQAGDLMALAA